MASYSNNGTCDACRTRDGIACRFRCPRYDGAQGKNGKEAYVQEPGQYRMLQLAEYLKGTMFFVD